MLDSDFRDILRPQKCYSVAELQELLNLSMLAIIEAVQDGRIARHLGEGFEMHLMGIDVIDWLENEPSVDSEALSG